MPSTSSLPPRAAYPLSGPKKKSRLDVGPYDEGRFEALYSDASCSLVLSAALLMKGFFPWAGRVRLSAWAREEGEVRCLVALDAGEEALVSVERFPSSEAPRILRELGAAIGIEDAHAEIRHGAGLDQHKAVCAHAIMRPAHLDGQRCRFTNRFLEAVHINIIVASAVHLGKPHRGSLL